MESGIGSDAEKAQKLENPEPQASTGLSTNEVQGAPVAVTAQAKADSLCGVCHLNPPKYKCPRCYLPYCSVACNRTHRENHPPDPEPAPQTQASETLPKEESTQTSNDQDQSNPFRALDTSQRLKYLFQKYPSLPDQLLKIHAATLPPQDAGPDKRLPASMMKGAPKNNKWNHDVGLRNGKDALRKARKAEGDEGKAIREYSELIVHLLNEGQNDHNATSIIQQQAADEDIKLIERLMAEERR